MGVEDEREEEYTGQPIIDEASLRGGMAIRRNIGEFGESLRPSYVVVSPVFSRFKARPRIDAVQSVDSFKILSRQPIRPSLPLILPKRHLSILPILDHPFLIPPPINPINPISPKSHPNVKAA